MKNLTNNNKRTLIVPVVALVVGHEPTRPGACTPGQGEEGCEYWENKPFVEALAARLGKRGIVMPVIVFRTKGYSALPGQINALDPLPAFGVSFHSNAYNEKASGTETLYCAVSAKSKSLARLLQTAMVRTLELPDRGVKARGRKDRGGTLLWETSMPFALVEPFFNDNLSDDKRWHERKDDLLIALTAVIEAYARSV